jgi:long-chain fatty acid transport protein
MKRNAIASAVSCGFALTVTSMQAQASAFALHEQGAAGLGNAYAGAAAVADDASTVWWNPAGMARLASGKQVSLGGTLIVPSTKFNNGGSTPAALSNPTLNGNGGDAGGAAVVPSLFFAMDVSPKWNIGLGVSVPFGQKTEYDSNWIGRFQGVKAEIKTVNINPAVSYKITDTASVGGGINYQRGEINLTSAVNYSAAAFGAGGPALLGAVGGAGVEGQNTTKLDGDAWGFNLGGLANVGAATRLGIHYRSALNYKMDGDTSFSNRPAALAAGIPDSDVKLNFKTPENVAMSLVHSLNDKLDLLADATWTHWSRIQQLPLVRSSGTQSGATLDTLTFAFKNTWRFSIGANYKLDRAWTLKVGAAYDQSPVPSAEARTVRLPDNDRYWLTFGARWQPSRSSTLDLGYAFIKVKDADINNNQNAAGRGTVTGSYEATVNVFGAQYQHTF